MYWPGTRTHRFVGVDGSDLMEDHSDVPHATRRLTRRRVAWGWTNYHPVVATMLGNAVGLVSARLAEVNGSRRARTLVLTEVAAAVSMVRNAKYRSFFVEGSYGEGWNYHHSRTTLALCVRVGGRIVLRVEECSAWKATPGKCWAVLRPWYKGDVEAKFEGWVADRKLHNLIYLD